MPSFSRLPFNYVSVGGISKPFKDVGGADFDASRPKETAAYEAVKQRIHKPGTLKSHGRHAEMAPPPHAWSMTEHDQTRELERQWEAPPNPAAAPQPPNLRSPSKKTPTRGDVHGWRYSWGHSPPPAATAAPPPARGPIRSHRRAAQERVYMTNTGERTPFRSGIGGDAGASHKHAWSPNLSSPIRGQRRSSRVGSTLRDTKADNDLVAWAAALPAAPVASKKAKEYAKRKGLGEHLAYLEKTSDYAYLGVQDLRNHVRELGPNAGGKTEGKDGEAASGLITPSEEMSQASDDESGDEARKERGARRRRRRTASARTRRSVSLCQSRAGTAPTSPPPPPSTPPPPPPQRR